VPTEILADLIACGATVRTVPHPGDRPPEPLPAVRKSGRVRTLPGFDVLLPQVLTARGLCDIDHDVVGRGTSGWTDVSLRARRTAPLAGRSMPIAQIYRPRTKPPSGAEEVRGKLHRAMPYICLLS
jgi:hypothetical protein